MQIQGLDNQVQKDVMYLQIRSFELFSFVTEEIPITVSRQAPDKEARPNPFE